MRLAAEAIARTEPTDDGGRGVIITTASIAENDYLNGEVIRLDGALRFPPK
jgi:hypothetical protein